MVGLVNDLIKQGIQVADVEVERIGRIESFCKWIFLSSITVFVWFLLALIFPYSEKSWRFPLITLGLLALAFWFFAFKLGRTIEHYEKYYNFKRNKLR